MIIYFTFKFSSPNYNRFLQVDANSIEEAIEIVEEQYGKSWYNYTTDQSYPTNATRAGLRCAQDNDL
jgi:hypothetical protein